MAKSKNTSRRRTAWSRQRIITSFQDFFLLSERERKGLRVLMILVLALWAFRIWGVGLIPEKRLEISVDDSRIIAGQLRQWSETREFESSGFGRKQVQLSLRRFDPNKADQEMLQGMGFPEPIARRWANYLKAGGSFRSAADLLRLYGMDSLLFSQIRDSLVFTFEEEPSKVRSTLPKSFTAIELNSADSVSLCALPGIGPVIASRILKYRARIGGFSDPSQLSAVYGMDSTRLRGLLPLLKADSSLIRPIIVNQADFATLMRHPLMTRELAYEISEWRRLHGRIASLEAIAGFRALPSERQRSLKLYFKP